MVKPKIVDLEALLKDLLKKLREDVKCALDGMFENISQALDGDWECINDDTPKKELPLHINSECKVTALFVKQRLKGVCIDSEETREALFELCRMCRKNIDNTDDPNLSYQHGILAEIADIMRVIGVPEAEYTNVRWWSHFDPWNR
jgi:hypothetical protein